MFDTLKFYRDTIKFSNNDLISMSWWQKRKMFKSIVKELPKYCNRTGYKLKWTWEWDIETIEKYDKFTGKLIGKCSVVKNIGIYGFIKHRSRYMFGGLHGDRYRYSITTGLMYYQEFQGFITESYIEENDPCFDIDSYESE